MAIKNKVMNIALFDSDEEAWEDHTITMLQTYRERHSNVTKGEWLYLGALEVRMGKRTAKRFVRLERFDTRKDQHGEKQYRYIVEAEEKGKELVKEAQLSKTKSIDAVEKSQFLTVAKEDYKTLGSRTLCGQCRSCS